MGTRLFLDFGEEFRVGIEPLRTSCVHFESGQVRKLKVKRALKVFCIFGWMFALCEMHEAKHIDQLMIRGLNA